MNNPSSPNLSLATPDTTASFSPPSTQYLAVPEGRIAYDDTRGEGPLIVLVPGIGDLRAQYRLVAPQLASAGYRVVTMDLRGLGESDTGFSVYNGEAIGRDVLALIRHLDAGPAIIVGNSISAGSAVYAAAEASELISRIVLVGGFTRGPVMNAPTRLLVRMLMAGPWRTAVWMGLHGTLFPLAKAADHDEHRARMRANLREAGRSDALAQMMLSNHDHAEARYDRVQVPSLFVMGTADSDFPDPQREAEEVSRALGGEVMLVEGAGHYPHVEAPRQFLRGLLDYLARTAPLQHSA
jgi:pimeloyl-ACP methyl ester carboxylesterase